MIAALFPINILLLIFTSPSNVVLPFTNKLLFIETSPPINKPLFIETSPTIRVLPFIEVSPTTNKLLFIETSPVKFAPLNKANPCFFTNSVVATLYELSFNKLVRTVNIPSIFKLPFNDRSPFIDAPLFIETDLPISKLPPNDKSFIIVALFPIKILEFNEASPFVNNLPFNDKSPSIDKSLLNDTAPIKLPPVEEI